MTPRATYRLQLHAGFTFADATELVPYLAELGISHAYLSPILAARAGSQHGYDTIDPTRVSPELGGEAGLRALAAALHAHGMGIVLDIVPNHMAAGGADNPWWLDVMRHGRASRYADYFDIDWTPPDPVLHHRILAPFLGTPYGEALAAGQITLVEDPAHGWCARYFEHLFPLRPEDAANLDPARHDPATRGGRSRLHLLLQRQHFRLAWWRTAADSINWRRFFDISSLIALRPEREAVFQATHAVLLRLYAEGLIDAFRIDHVDGLALPAAYGVRLRAALRAAAPARPEPWIVVEKILAPDERLEPDWPYDGTSGYDFLARTNALLHAPDGVAALEADWQRRTGRPGFAAEERVARAEILDTRFSAQLSTTAAALGRLAQRDLSDRDRPIAALRRCLTQILIHFPRYRSYASEGAGGAALAAAIAGAEQSCLPADRAHLPRIAHWLSPGTGDAEAIRRFEQLSAPVAAKSVEDTTFYRHGPLLSLNEVGAHPELPIGDRAGWLACGGAMLATATHDHKRGEDMRARLAVLSEMPAAWTARLDRWVPRLGPIDPADAVMLLQTLVGAWPPDGELSGFQARIAAWQVKALREAKRHSSWVAPNAEYEAAGAAALELALGDAALRDEIAGFVAEIAPFAVCKSLVQVVLKLCATGVPDIYQGREFMDFSLVDPDNRRAVDFNASAPADRMKQHVVRRLLGLRRTAPALFAGGDCVELAVQGVAQSGLFALTRSGPGQRLVAICPLRPVALLDAAGAPRAEAFGDSHVPLDPRLRWHDVLGECAVAGGAVAPLLRRLPVAVLLGTAD